MHLFFIETEAFTARSVRLGLEDELARLEWMLQEVPDLGDLERAMHGIRKVRIA